MQKKQINVLHILSSFGLGGTERLTLYLARYWNSHQINIHICTLFSKDDPEEEPLLDEILKTDIPLLRLSLTSYRDFKTIRLLRNYIKENNIDIIHAHSGATEFWAPLFGKILKVDKNIYTHHHTDYRKPLMRLFQNWCTKNILTDKIVAVSDTVKNDLINIFKINSKKISIIYNPVDIKHFRSISNEKIKQLKDKYKIQPNDFIIGNISRYTDEKGYPFFFKAAKIISKEINNVKFLVVSNERTMPIYRLLAKENSVEDKIIIVNPVCDVAPLLKCLDLFLFTSIWGEGFGMVLIEALAAGVPVVSSNIGPTKEIIKDGYNGLLPTPKKWMKETEWLDPESLADAILKIYNDKNLRDQLIENGYKSLAPFSIEKYINSLEKLYLSFFP